jgi:glycerate kinase
MTADAAAEDPADGDAAAHGEPAGRPPLTVVIAPDSFKGSLTSVEVAQALAAGWRRARPQDRILLAPLADGGEGTLVAIEAAGGWIDQRTIVQGPNFHPTAARWLRSEDGTRAVVELAQASGISLVDPWERDPLHASTVGTGEVLEAVLDAGIRRITLGIGGSATTDGGWGILHALGVRWVGEMPGIGYGDSPAWNPAELSLDELDPRLRDVDLRIACDVTNPLLGPSGAAATYGPQKGADPETVVELEALLARFADALEATTGRHERTTPGSGAAGGTAFGLLCLGDRFRSLELVPGVDLVAEETDLAGKLRGADLVITGEGRIDAQTAFGKTALGVARRAAEAGIGCIAVGGSVQPAGIDALATLGAVAVPVMEGPSTVEEAMAAGPAPVHRCGERIARLVGIGRLAGLGN